ncbi:unnamed protein product [Mytilus coruscus]|uniref:Uncharacterized protein n=1 Tax=Mytilus coruscus TaxID=42192 RepID=A0A6J8E4K5_MYTCO|nr:unnamed protein product [Mytilus coruscus]
MASESPACNICESIISQTIQTDDRKEIQIARHTVNEHFDRLQRELLKELQIIENDKRKEISKILAPVERKEKEIDGLQISLAIIKQHASDLQTFLVSKQIEHELIDTDNLIQSIQNNSELSGVIVSLQTIGMMKSLGNISRFGQTSQSDMSLVRQKIKQAQAKVAVVTKGSLDHQHGTIKTEEGL